MKDGKLSAEEDFANNMEYYLFNPNKLKAISTPAYNWIKGRFGEQIKPIKKIK